MIILIVHLHKTSHNFSILMNNTFRPMNDYDPDEEEDEETIIERKRKQREELMKKLAEEKRIEEEAAAAEARAKEFTETPGTPEVRS